MKITKIKLNPGTGSPPSSPDPAFATSISDTFMSKGGALSQALLLREKLITVADNGSFQLDMSYFDYATGLTMTNKKFDALFGGPPRTSETELTQREMDLAASVQKVTEDIVLELARGIAKETGERNLCLAGGVALNCVANGILFWYVRRMIGRMVYVSQNIGDILQMSRNFRKHVQAVSELETFYGDETIEFLLQHSTDFANQLEDFYGSYSVTEENWEINIDVEEDDPGSILTPT